LSASSSEINAIQINVIDAASAASTVAGGVGGQHTQNITLAVDASEDQSQI